QLKKEPYANKDYYGAVSTSPLGNELLLELARRAIDAEGLGGGAIPDLLCLSFSATDVIGHSGIIFATPLFGMAVGAAFGALGSTFRDYGIDDDFIKRIRSQVTEGTSALFLMTSDAVMDRVVEAMKGVKFEIIATNLSKEQEQKLH